MGGRSGRIIRSGSLPFAGTLLGPEGTRAACGCLSQGPEPPLVARSLSRAAADGGGLWGGGGWLFEKSIVDASILVLKL